jgi:hypothetical protein
LIFIAIVEFINKTPIASRYNKNQATGNNSERSYQAKIQKLYSTFA